MPRTTKPPHSNKSERGEQAAEEPKTDKPKVPMQTFLVGRTVYLRALVLADSSTARFWDDSPFPLSSDVLEEQMKEDVPNASSAGTRRLVICRRSDDGPVGSVEMHTEDGHTTDITPFVPAVFGSVRRDAILTEVIRLIVPWLLHEHDQLAVRLLVDAGSAAIEKAAVASGMQVAYVLREARIGPGGERFDQVCWQGLHPTWLANLGAPEPSVFGNVEREVRSPAPAEYPRRSKEPPANAMLVGKWIYLRPIEQDDADEIAKWSMRETQTAYDTGRSPRSPISYWHWSRKNYEADPPNWIRFAICLVKDESVIGSNGLAFVDWIHRTAETETEIVQPGPGTAEMATGPRRSSWLRRYGFGQLGLHMVRSVAWAFSRRLQCAAEQGYRGCRPVIGTASRTGHLLTTWFSICWRVSGELLGPRRSPVSESARVSPGVGVDPWAASADRAIPERPRYAG